MNEVMLIDLYWNRSEDAIIKTKQKYGRYCNRIAFNILHNHEDSEECVNDTYLKVWNAIPTDKPNIFSAYLGKTTRNLAINMYHKATAQKFNYSESKVKSILFRCRKNLKCYLESEGVVL